MPVGACGPSDWPWSSYPGSLDHLKLVKTKRIYYLFSSSHLMLRLRTDGQRRKTAQPACASPCILSATLIPHRISVHVFPHSAVVTLPCKETLELTKIKHSPFNLFT